MGTGNSRQDPRIPSLARARRQPRSGRGYPESCGRSGLFQARTALVVNLAPRRIRHRQVAGQHAVARGLPVGDLAQRRPNPSLEDGADQIERQFKAANNWPFGSALSFLLIYLTFIAVALQALASRKPQRSAA